MRDAAVTPEQEIQARAVVDTIIDLAERLEAAEARLATLTAALEVIERDSKLDARKLARAALAGSEDS